MKLRHLSFATCLLTVLAIPKLAMQFTNEVNWSNMDFLIAGGLLTTAFILVELALRNIQRLSWRILATAIIGLLLTLLWLELAVGVFGTPIAGS